MKLHLMRDRDGDGFHVWVSLDHTLKSELLTSGETFIIASGETRQAAMQNAIAELSTQRAKLRARMKQ